MQDDFKVVLGQQLHHIVTQFRCMLYPPECPVCQKLLVTEQERQRGCHDSCYQQLKRIVSPFCLKCGKPLLNSQEEYCYDCVKKPKSYESGRGLWLYDKVSSHSIFQYKYNGKQAYARFYVDVLVHFYGEWIRSLNVDALIAVPISKQKMKLRGFNQAQLIVEGLSEQLHIRNEKRLLLRLHSTIAQKELSKEERMKNLEQAFVANKQYAAGIKKVLLVDDIYTTGSTVMYCTNALKKVGIERVWFLTLCIGGGF